MEKTTEKNVKKQQGKRRKNGEGTWGTKTIKGVVYKFYRDVNGKYFYGRTDKEVNEKRKNFSKSKISNKTTFGEYLLWYHKNIHKSMVTESTYSEYIRICDIIINCEYFDIASIQLGAFSEKNNYIKQYIEAITPYYSLNYIKNQYIKMKLAIKYAEKHGQIEKGLLDDIKLPREANVGSKAKKIPFLTKDIADKLYEIIDDKYYNGNPRYGFNYWVAILIIHTGLRLQEVRALRLNDIDFERKLMTIDEAIVKIKDVETEIYTYTLKSTKNTFSERKIPLNAVAIDMLQRIIKFSKPKHDTDFICITRDGGYVKNDKISEASDRLLRDSKSPIKHCNPHALRHTFGSMLFEEDVDLKVISELMGHSSIVTTANVYIGLTAKKKDSAVQKLLPENKEEIDL